MGQIWEKLRTFACCADNKTALDHAIMRKDVAGVEFFCTALTTANSLVRVTPFASAQQVEKINLPRQTRDKHTETLTTQALPAGMCRQRHKLAGPARGPLATRDCQGDHLARSHEEQGVVRKTPFLSYFILQIDRLGTNTIETQTMRHTPQAVCRLRVQWFVSESAQDIILGRPDRRTTDTRLGQR